MQQLKVEFQTKHWCHKPDQTILFKKVRSWLEGEGNIESKRLLQSKILMTSSMVISLLKIPHFHIKMA